MCLQKIQIYLQKLRQQNVSRQGPYDKQQKQKPSITVYQVKVSYSHHPVLNIEGKKFRSMAFERFIKFAVSAVKS